jgi:hypothetical protein
MAIGDLRDITVTGIGNAVPNEFNIYESIFNSYGPAVDLGVVDADDSASNIKGNEDLEIKFTVDGGGQVGFKFKTFTGKNLTDHAGNKENPGSLKNKQYTVRGVSVEALNAQGNYVEKAWDDKTTNIAKEVIEKYYKTDKSVEVEDQAKDQRTWRAQNEHPKDVIQKLNEQHVSNSNKGSAYCVFQEQSNGTQKYKITSFEELFKKGSVGKWAQRADLDSSSADENAKRNSIMWFNAGENFNVAADHLAKAQEQSFNRDTHSPTSVPPKQNKFKVLNTEARNHGQNSNTVPVNTQVALTNDKQSTTVAKARADRQQFLARLAENSATFEIPGSSDVKLGCIMEIDIPKRTATGGGKERQFNGKVCVVEIRHKIRPPGQVPRYTQVIKAIKAGFEG